MSLAAAWRALWTPEPVLSLGLPAAAVATREGSIENPSTPWDVLFEAMDGGRTAAGVSVTSETALQISTFTACVRIISEAVARIGADVLRESDGAKILARDHYLFPLFRYQAQPGLSSFRFRRLMQAWILIHGNAFAEIRERGGRIVALDPVDPRSVEPLDGHSENGYVVTERSGRRRPVVADMMFHLRGMETDETGMGKSIVRMARESLGAAKAVEQFGSKLFQGGAGINGFVTVPRMMKAEEKALMVRMLNRKNVEGIQVFDEGSAFHPTSMPADDAQFLTTRQFGVVDICRWFGVPPVMVGDLSSVRDSNIEQLSRLLLDYCLDGHLTNWEAEASTQLLSEMDRDTISLLFDRDELVMPDAKTQAAIAAIYRQNGIRTANEVREELGDNPHADGGELLANGSLTPVKVLNTKTTTGPAIAAPAA